MKVSIIIPCFNQAHYLPDALDSCLSQTWPDREIIVVDDGSTDNTRDVVARYDQVLYLCQPNRGPSAARNHGLQRAQGDYVQFLDADDMLLPEKLERSLAVFAEQPQLGVVYCDFEVRTPDMGRPVGDGPAHGSIGLSPDQSVLQQLLSQPRTLFAPHCALTRREALAAVGGFNEKLIGPEDWFLWISLAARGVAFAYLDEVLAWYREHPQSLSNQALPMAYQRLNAYQALRQLELPAGIIDLDRAIAGRHHALAMVLWRHKKTAEARLHFREAIRMERGFQFHRRLLSLLTFVAPADWPAGLLSSRSQTKAK